MKKLYYLVLLCTFFLMLIACQQESTIQNINASSPISVKAGKQVEKNNASENQMATPVQKELTGLDFFIGEWAIWLPGGYAESKSPDFGDGSVSIKRDYVSGIDGYVLTINADNTYIWDISTETIIGNWEEADKGRIVLLNGKYEFDWYVEKTGNDEIKFYSFGVEEFGTRMQR